MVKKTVNISGPLKFSQFKYNNKFITLFADKHGFNMKDKCPTKTPKRDNTEEDMSIIDIFNILSDDCEVNIYLEGYFERTKNTRNDFIEGILVSMFNKRKELDYNCPNINFVDYRELAGVKLYEEKSINTEWSHGVGDGRCLSAILVKYAHIKYNEIIETQQMIQQRDSYKILKKLKNKTEIDKKIKIEKKIKKESTKMERPIITSERKTELIKERYLEIYLKFLEKTLTLIEPKIKINPLFNEFKNKISEFTNKINEIYKKLIIDEEDYDKIVNIFMTIQSGFLDHYMIELILQNFNKNTAIYAGYKHIDNLITYLKDERISNLEFIKTIKVEEYPLRCITIDTIYLNNISELVEEKIKLLGGKKRKVKTKRVKNLKGGTSSWDDFMISLKASRSERYIEMH